VRSRLVAPVRNRSVPARTCDHCSSVRGTVRPSTPITCITAGERRKARPGCDLHASDRRSLNLPNTRPASMAAAQDVEHGQMLLNSCVLLPTWYLILTHWTSPEPSTSPNSGTSQGREYVDPFLSCSDARLRTALVQHSNRGIAGKAIPDTC
jgi:hypothetical protein